MPEATNKTDSALSPQSKDRENTGTRSQDDQSHSGDAASTAQTEAGSLETPGRRVWLKTAQTHPLLHRVHGQHIFKLVNYSVGNSAFHHDGVTWVCIHLAQA